MSQLVPWQNNGNAIAWPRFERPVPVETQSPTGLKTWWQEVRAQAAPPERSSEAWTGIRHQAESAGMAAILALIETDLGGLDFAGKIPLDWVGAAAFYALSLREGARVDGFASDFQALAQACTAVAMFRTTTDWRKAAKAGGKTRAVGSGTGDPVLEAGKKAF